uniref:NAD(P)H-hydrate epimerase n=1 Tax=Strongyloides stercoralis TaxID=6248 RepID=A0A0K0DUH9_STRER
MSFKYLKQDEAIKIDQELFSTYGFSVDQLMELAGLASAQAVVSHYEKTLLSNQSNKILIICGPGNNGGDGLVCARHLKIFGYSPIIFYPKKSKNVLMEKLVTQCQQFNIPFVNEMEDTKKFSLIIDAIFGFSFKPPLREPYGEILKDLANTSTSIASIDIPSGWDVESGPLLAPKLCAKYFKGTGHYLGGRFIPQSLSDKYQLNLPKYQKTEGILKLNLHE